MFKSLAFVTVFTLSSLSLSSPAVASFGASSGASVIDPTCKQNELDPYDLGWRITDASRAARQVCVDGTRMRTGIVVSTTGPAEAQEIEVANFLYQGKFWVARVNLDDVRELGFVMVHFRKGIPKVDLAHTQLRVHMNRGVDLRDQITGELAGPVNDFIISWETVFPKGLNFNLLTTIAPNYPIAGRVLATETTLRENFRVGYLRRMDEYSLNLSKDEMKSIIAKNFELMNERGLSRFYRLLSNNCVTTMFEIMDTVFQTTRPEMMKTAKPYHVKWNFDPVVGPAAVSMEARGLHSKQDPITSINAEFGMPLEPR